MTPVQDIPTTDSTSSLNPEVVDEWFGAMIDRLKVDHFMLQTNTASRDKEDFYKGFIFNDTQKIFTEVRSASSQYFVQSLVVDYLNELNSAGRKPLKLALGMSDSKILVWSEISDNDESMEDILLITEAKVNGRYHDNGFYINSTIVEASDRLPIPPHYQTIIE